MGSYEYTIQSLANRYHVTETTVNNWIKTGKLEATERFGCRPKWYISEEQIEKFELNYARRIGIKPKIAKSGIEMHDGKLTVTVIDDSEADDLIRVSKGMKALNDVLEKYPYLKEMILELADRL